MKRICREEIEAVLKVLFREPVCLSGFYKNPRGGPSVQAFEERLASYVGVKHAVAVSNGTTALQAALLAAGVGPGDEVITTPLSFSATATSILMCGAKPVFVDVDYTYNLNPYLVEEAITPDTKLILPVHLLGTPCEMDPLLEISEEHGIPIIEDNAQALGATYGEKKTGSLGLASICSFQETKPITTLGEGGAVLTDDDEFADKVRLLRNHGSQYAEAPFLCYNWRMTEAQAAFGLAQLEKLDGFIEMQIKNSHELMRALPTGVEPPRPRLGCRSTYYILGCLCEPDFPRDRFIEIATEKGLNRNLPGATVSKGYTRTLMDLPVLSEYRRSCPRAEDYVTRFLWFDVCRWRTPHEMDEVIAKVEDVCSTLGTLGTLKRC
ncbi:MAG: DegT/DnrJ/EryC1/StrS family aminotransferase [Deltaproteobacteria bacterium]|nr:DegT/DnrJ/EryC1/StrS family aminotransferase [Deltaproteobacteria bacterium]